MNRTFSTLALALVLTSTTVSQSPPPPNPLPRSVTNVPADMGAKLVRFDTDQLGLKRNDLRWQLWAGKQFIKDLGTAEREAAEAFRLVRELGCTQYGTIAGASPTFEFWLSGDEACKGGLAVKNVIPFNAKTLKAERVTGAWVVRDDKQMLYNFGGNEEAAKQALAVLKRYGFNQLGVVGIARPIMTYLTVDPYAHAGPVAPTATDPKEMIGQIGQQGLVLPRIGYVGSRMPVEHRKLEVVRVKSEWTLVSGADVLGRFGHDSRAARDAERILQDARITEVCLVGKAGFPIFLSSGQAPRYTGLGFNNVRLHPAKLSAAAINDVWCVAEGKRPILQFGDNRADAELMLKVLQHFEFDQIVPVGNPNKGGIRLFARSK